MSSKKSTPNAAEFYGSGKHNPTAYFPTPMHISIMMAKMTMTKEDKTKSMCDPCVGSGRFIMVASNYCLNLYGMDIDHYILNICKLNMWMYVPWAIFRPKCIKGLDRIEGPIKKGDGLAVNPIQKTTPKIQKKLLNYVQPDLFEK